MQHNVGPPTQYRFNVRPVTQPIAGSMPVNRIRHWPSIETELGECPVFALTAIRVTLYPTKGHYADDTIHWPNCEIMLGHHLQRWANIIPTKTLNHEYNRECFFFWRLFKHESTQPIGTTKVHEITQVKLLLPTLLFYPYAGLEPSISVQACTYLYLSKFFEDLLVLCTWVSKMYLYLYPSTYTSRCIWYLKYTASTSRFVQF